MNTSGTVTMDISFTVLISAFVVQLATAAPTDNQFYNPLVVVPGSSPLHFLPFQDDLSAAPSSYHVNHGDAGVSYSRIVGAAHQQPAYPYVAAAAHIPQPVYQPVQLPLPPQVPVLGHHAYVHGGQGSYQAAPSVGVGHYVGGDKGHEHKKGGGSQHHASHHGSHGNKGHKGHKSTEGYEKGESGKHDKENHSGHYAEDGGNKKGEHEEKGYHGSHEAGHKGEKGGSHGEKGHHKKGSSTKGFHNVYHKDEYKKEHSFYDDEHKEGFKKHYGSEDEHHSHKKGGHEKGGHHKSGHHEDSFGKKGSYDKGHHNEEAKGHKGEHGHDDYHEDHQEYGKKGGEEGSSSHGHSSKGHGRK